MGAQWSENECERLDALVSHFALAEMQDDLRTRIRREYVPSAACRGAVDKLLRYVHLSHPSHRPYPCPQCHAVRDRLDLTTTGGQ